MWLVQAREYVRAVLKPRMDSVRSEVAVAIDWTGHSASELTIEHRKYPDMPGHMFGTADLLGVTKEGKLYVGDWKTGGTGGANEQLLTLACGFDAVYPENTGVIISCLSVDEKGVWPSEREVSHEELVSHWLGMQMAWESIGKDLVKRPGIHCTQLYCPHLAYCDAIQGVVVAAAEQEDKVGDSRLLKPEQLTRKYRMTGTPTSSEEAGYVMERVSAAGRQMKYYTQCLKDYVRDGGVVQSGDYTWSEKADGFRWRKTSR